MSDPQDLLYTNQFTNPNVLSEHQLQNETQYYDRFKNYIDKEGTSEIKKYVQNNEYESSPINLNKTLNQKWPIRNNKNNFFRKFIGTPISI